VPTNFGRVLRQKKEIVSKLIERREWRVDHADFREQRVRNKLRERTLVKVALPSVSGREDVPTLHLQSLPVTACEIRSEGRVKIGGRVEPDEVDGGRTIEVEIRSKLEFEFGSVDGALDKLTVNAAEREVKGGNFREDRHRSRWMMEN
jgi:hypothetical protein